MAGLVPAIHVVALQKSPEDLAPAGARSCNYRGLMNCAECLRPFGAPKPRGWPGIPGFNPGTAMTMELRPEIRPVQWTRVSQRSILDRRDLDPSNRDPAGRASPSLRHASSDAFLILNVAGVSPCLSGRRK